MTKKYLSLLIFLFTFFCSFSQNEGFFKIKGYSGGMCANLSHIKSQPFLLSNNTYEQVDTWTNGIGGKAAIHFGNYLRVGSEGYGSAGRYGTHDNYYKVGWGGITTDIMYHISKFRFFAGVTFGGGKIKHMVLMEKPNSDFNAIDAVWSEYSFLMLAPVAGIEFSLTSKIWIITKVDYMRNLNNPMPDFSSGARYYFGIIFNRPL